MKTIYFTFRIEWRRNTAVPILSLDCKLNWHIWKQPGGHPRSAMLRLECLTAIKGFLSCNRKYGKAARPNQSLPTSPQGERRISPAKPSPEDPRAERTRELSPALGFHLVELCFILKALCMSEQRRERIGRAGSAAGGRASARRARVPHGDRPGLPAPPGPGAVTETHYASRRNDPQSHAETQQQPLS